MTDKDVMNHPSVRALVRALERADAALVKAAKKTGRRLQVYVGDGESIVDRDTHDAGYLGTPLDEGGSIVAHFTVSGSWEGGGF